MYKPLPLLIIINCCIISVAAPGKPAEGDAVCWSRNPPPPLFKELVNDLGRRIKQHHSQVLWFVPCM